MGEREKVPRGGFRAACLADGGVGSGGRLLGARDFCSQLLAHDLQLLCARRCLSRCLRLALALAFRQRDRLRRIFARGLRILPGAVHLRIQTPLVRRRALAGDAPFFFVYTRLLCQLLARARVRRVR